jgi:hypothetical protein
VRCSIAATSVALLLLSLAVLAGAQPAAQPQSEFKEWADSWGAYFDANPELKVTKSSGWKPYNRFKWFYEQRMDDGQDIPLDGRWNAFQVKQERAAIGRKTAGTSWFALGPDNFAGRMLDIDIDPTNTNIIYAGAASGGIWKSTNAGVTWIPLDDELPTLAVGAVAVCPSDPNIIVIGTGEPTNNIDRVGGVGILRSTDGGATWSTTSFSTGIASGHGFNAIEFNATGTIAIAAALDTLLRSTDQGLTWQGTSAGGSYTDVRWVRGSADTVFNCRSGSGEAGSRVRRSIDGGVTWTVVGGAPQGLPDPLTWGRGKIAITPANSQYIYLHLANIDGTFKGVYRTTNGGTSWALRNSTLAGQGYGGQAWYNCTMEADPNNAERVFVGATPLFRSNNGGSAFSTIGGNVHVDHHAITYVPGNDDRLFVGTDGGIWESSDDGLSWTDRNSTLTTYQFYDICVSPPDEFRSWGGTQDNGTDRWVNSNIWLNGLGADGMVCNGHPTDPLTVYGEIQFGDHRKSTNGGASWFQINAGIGGSGAWVTPVEIDANDGNHLFTAASDGLYRTTNGGALWVNIDPLGANSISVSPANGDIVWTLNISSARVSTDDGATWTPAAPLPPVGSGTRVLAHPTVANTVFATFSSYVESNAHIVRSTDLGATWEDVSGDFPAQPVNAIVVDPTDPTHWFIGTDVGVWFSINDGVNWLPLDDGGLANAVIADLEIQNSGRKLRAGTHGRGMWEIDISQIGGETDVPGGTPLSESNHLLFDAPRPNPLTDATVLRYAARRPGEQVNLSVYDAQGRLVARLAEHSADGFIRQVQWSTQGVANGVYFALLKSGGEEKSQKLVVVK